MKKSLISFSLFFATLLWSNELTWVDEQVEAIKPPRSGISNQLLASTQNPFIFLKKDEKKEKKSNTPSKLLSPVSTSKATTSKPKTRALTLWLVVNKSAKINDTWYKEGDKLAGYKVEKINTKSVLLTKKNKKLLLSTRSSSSKLKFKNK